jgi:hypothetical protein
VSGGHYRYERPDRDEGLVVAPLGAPRGGRIRLYIWAGEDALSVDLPPTCVRTLVEALLAGIEQ